MAGGFCPDTTCAILVNSRCAYYEAATLPYTGILTNDSLQTALQKIEDVIENIINGGGSGSSVWGSITGTITDQLDLINYLSTNYVPQSRILTINGIPFDLSANRSWSVGIITSITGGVGISVTGTATIPIITNTLPDQTVVINNGTGISVTGIYPNFTVTNTSPSSGGTVTSVAALTLGSIGTDLSSSVANSTTTPVITLNVPTASAVNRGVLSSSDWSTFNGKQNTLVGSQGDTLYFSALNTISNLAKDTNSSRYLSNTGASNSPLWAQINLTDGVTGILPITNGGTGTATTFTVGSIVFAGVSGIYSQDNSTFFWDNTNKGVAIGVNALNTVKTRLNLKAHANDGSSNPIYIENSSSVRTFVIGDDSTLYLGSNTVSFIRKTSNGNTGVNTGTAWLFQADSTTTVPHFNWKVNGNISSVAGTIIVGGTNASAMTINPASGTANIRWWSGAPTINQTGGTGIITGYDWSPTVTLVTGTHLAWRNTSGSLLFGGTTITAGSVLADFQSTTLGVILPRVTNIASVATPVAGMIAYDAATNKFNFRENATWVQISAGGITNSAAANELMKSNGTNAIPSGIFSTTDGSIILGSSSIAGDRTLSIASSAGTSNLTISSKGTSGTVNLQSNFILIKDPSSVLYGQWTLAGGTISQIGFVTAIGQVVGNVYVDGTPGGDVQVIGGSSGAGASGNVYIDGGTGATITRGNIGLLTTTGSFGSGEKVIFVSNALISPTTNPANGFILYSEDLAASAKPKIRDEAGNNGYIPIVLYGSATLNFGSISGQSGADLTIAVTGASVGDPVILGTPVGSIPGDFVFFPFVSAADTVTVRAYNGGLVSGDPASGTYKVTVVKQ